MRDGTAQRAADGGPPPGPDHQQVARFVGDVDEDRPGVAALDPQLDAQVVGHAAEAGFERLGQPAARGLGPEPAQVRGGMAPLSHITARRHPGDYRHERHLPVPRLLGRPAQRLQAAERPVYYYDDPVQRVHDASLQTRETTMCSPHTTPRPALTRPTLAEP